MLELLSNKLIVRNKILELSIHIIVFIGKISAQRLNFTALALES